MEKFGFTENKDIDRLILVSLTDRDLLHVLTVNSYLNKLADENFFEARTIKNFPALVLHKPLTSSWRNFYLSRL